MRGCNHVAVGGIPDCPASTWRLTRPDFGDAIGVNAPLFSTRKSMHSPPNPSAPGRPTMHAIRIDRSKPLCDEPTCGHNRYHPDIAPAAEIGEGEEIALETRDA